MSYTVKSSERLRKSGSEAETKALLYLMNFRPDSDDIYYFVVDFFNDLICSIAASFTFSIPKVVREESLRRDPVTLPINRIYASKVNGLI